MTPSHDDTPEMHTRRKQAARAMRRCWTMTGAAVLLTGLGLAACAPTVREPAPTAPAPAPSPVPAPLPPVAVPDDWRDAPISAGEWTYRADANATRALFGSDVADFVMACEPGNRQIKLWRMTPDARATTMTITTTSQTKMLTAQPAANGQVVATLAPHDPIIDAMIFSRGRFAVAAPGTRTLYMPTWAEIARVAEDCR
ncbi:hypothetical protein [uncultured Croceicoccus sp.]|uniref:hypothetical protein n=1 Tax=uncultured Croceicoccus sp. TaxID=1295329 RepID=UPI002633D982|nr:hypothetical protein [uncultured Croceicoccus sp.]